MNLPNFAASFYSHKEKLSKIIFCYLWQQVQSLPYWNRERERQHANWVAWKC